MLIVLVGVDTVVAQHIDAGRRAGRPAGVIRGPADLAIAVIAVAVDRAVVRAPVDVERLEHELRIAIRDDELDGLVDGVCDCERSCGPRSGVGGSAKTRPPRFRQQVAYLPGCCRCSAARHRARRPRRCSYCCGSRRPSLDRWRLSSCAEASRARARAHRCSRARRTRSGHRHRSTSWPARACALSSNSTTTPRAGASIVPE